MKKNVKRLICVLMLGVMMVMLGACGEGEQTVTCKLDQEIMLQEITMEAKNDIITKWTQTTTIYLDKVDDATQDALDVSAEMMKGIYAEYDKVTYEVKKTGDSFVEILTIDMTDSKTIQSLADAELLPVTGNASKISLKKTVDSLKSQGWITE